MTKPAGLSLRGFADFSHIDTSLKSLWHPFKDLVSEMNLFIPRPIKDYEAEYNRLVDYYQELNPNESKESIANHVQIEIDMESSELGQFHKLFINRFMTQYVIVAMISHTLCEASINAILAFGLGMKHSKDQELAQEIFSRLEKKDIKEKWCSAPKEFSPNYKLDKGTVLFDTLNYLTKQRNALIHHKINLHIEGKLMFEGSNPQNKQPPTFEKNIEWIKRFFSLPYDLSTHASKQLGFPSPVCYDRGFIPIAEQHKKSKPQPLS